jgi:fructose-bisphosphate aldolase/2-amino-3,7-dideoxy-D-threo-hept-6-ulosonate synthase
MPIKTVIDVGKQVRLNRIINPTTGNMIMVPMDHGIILGAVQGIADIADTFDKVVAGGADSIAFNAGMSASLYTRYSNRCGTVFQLTNAISDDDDLTLIASVEYALRQGADAVSIQVIVGSKHERRMLDDARAVVEQSNRWGIPLMTMMYPSESFYSQHGARAIQRSARAGAELGADIVKTSYSGDHDSFQELVDSCPVPVVVAGGAKKDTVVEVLEMIEDAIACGACGIALGRNIWQSSDPQRMVESIVEIVHHGKKASELEWVG